MAVAQRIDEALQTDGIFERMWRRLIDDKRYAAGRHKSSYSNGEGGNCVEIADGVPAPAWSGFLTSLR